MFGLDLLWIVLTGVAAPIVGVVGFAIQLRQVKKLRLENEKLSLEIYLLKQQLNDKNSVIVRPEAHEVIELLKQGKLRASVRASSAGMESEDVELDE